MSPLLCNSQGSYRQASLEKRYSPPATLGSQRPEPEEAAVLAGLGPHGHLGSSEIGQLRRLPRQ
eukprot:15371783-Alexandrium_andersonii.AAC.1